MTSDDAPEYGPIIWRAAQQRFEVNQGGCTAVVLGDDGENGCGALVQALIECIDAACASCDPKAPDACGCTTAAQAGPCKSFVAPASCATPFIHGGSPLVNGCITLPRGDYFSVARTLCGGAP